MKISGGCYCKRIRYAFDGDIATSLQGSIALKIGTMDDPSFFVPSAAIFTKDKQSFHHISPDIPSFEGAPG